MADYPGDIVRVRMQDQVGRSSQYRHFLDAMVQIGRNEGIPALYAGFQVNTLRTLPQCSITFFCYEYVKAQVQKMDQRVSTSHNLERLYSNQ